MGKVQAIDVYHAADATHYSATQVIHSACFLAVIVSSHRKKREIRATLPDTHSKDRYNPHFALGFQMKMPYSPYRQQ